MARFRILVALAVLAAPALGAQEVPLEYQVKAGYLYNFIGFVEWPAERQDGPVTICVAGRNPFGGALEDTVRGARVGGRTVTVRTVTAPADDCHVLFVPEGVAAAAYLRRAAGTPTLTVGESSDFLRAGGIVNFIREGGRVRFAIDADAAARAGLRISSRLLRLARMPDES